MSEEIRVGRPQMPGQPHYENHGHGSGKLAWVILGLLAILIIVGAVLFRDKLFASKDTGATSEYQAVFLTNGQVYFGKLEKSSKDHVVLTDIYYLQVTQPPLQGSQQQGQQAQSQPQIQLVKLGNELHGPEDKMFISREHVLFYENIKTEGKVAQAIKDYKNNPQGSTQGATQQRATPPAANPAPAQTAPATQTPPPAQPAQ